MRKQTKRQQQQQKETDESTLTEMQNVKQKMAEALHIQRQYKTILDVMQTEKISHERQLIELEKSIADVKNEAEKLKVFLHFCCFFKPSKGQQAYRSL